MQLLIMGTFADYPGKLRRLILLVNSKPLFLFKRSVDKHGAE